MTIKIPLLTCKKKKIIKKACRRLKRKYQRTFKQKSHITLKEALKNKLIVVKAKWSKHYLRIDYLDQTFDKIYCNFAEARWELRQRLFHVVSPCLIVNLYYFNEFKVGAKVPTLVFSGKMEEVLGKNEMKTVFELKLYMRGPLMMQDIKRMLR